MKLRANALPSIHPIFPKNSRELTQAPLAFALR
jgi:hypothetical protein